MPVPNTLGKLCTNLKDMEVGDYIPCNYAAPTANVAGSFSDLGTLNTELPLTPTETVGGGQLLLH